MRSVPLSDSGSPTPNMAEEDFGDLFEHAPCGYLSVSADGRITLSNARIAQWTGFSKSELAGKKLHDLLSVAARIFYETNIFPLLRMQGFVDEIAMDFVARDGAKVQCLVNAVERRDADGGLLYTRFAILRAAERRRYERSLVESRDSTERAAAEERETSHLREQFIAVLGHDLRNPLASISSGVRLLTSREEVSEKGRHILSLMQGSVIRASELIDNVLDFARGRLGGGVTLTRDAKAPLTPVLEQVVAELKSISPGRDVRERFDIAEPVDCDRVRLGQLLSNLLGNALTHGSRSEPVWVQADTDGHALRICVVNGGTPIDAATMERLFQPFFRGEIRPNQVGLGLGLHIASEIARAHGGELTVNSDARETRFTFLMPLTPAEATA